MDQVTIARWQGQSDQSIEHLVLREGQDGITAESVLLGQVNGDWFAARYRIVCNLDWRVQKVKVEMIGEEREVELIGDGNSHWTNNQKTSLKELDGAIDIDISATPFTNTLPIRRVGLPTGQSADILVVYIRLPELIITTDQQRYTCLIPNQRYRFQSVDTDFVRDLEVDGQGLVESYPGLFQRVR